MPRFDEDHLEYGYILLRLPTGQHWHGHFARSNLVYHCRLLGRETDVLMCIQRFTSNVCNDSALFYLTLDGEGIDPLPEDLALDYRWGKSEGDQELQAAATHFQQEIMPLLHRSRRMQRAVWEVVNHQRYRRIAPPGRFTPPS